MLIGGFNGTRPQLPGLAAFPDLNLVGQVIFLVDTGADVSVIGPGDSAALGLDRAIQLGNPHIALAPTPVVGFGGKLHPYLAKAYIVFPAVDSISGEAEKPYCYAGEIDVLTPAMLTEPDPSCWPSSCLGWDMLRMMARIDFRPPEHKSYFCLTGEVPPA